MLIFWLLFSINFIKLHSPGKRKFDPDVPGHRFWRPGVLALAGGDFYLFVAAGVTAADDDLSFGDLEVVGE